MGGEKEKELVFRRILYTHIETATRVLERVTDTKEQKWSRHKKEKKCPGNRHRAATTKIMCWTHCNYIDEEGHG